MAHGFLGGASGNDELVEKLASRAQTLEDQMKDAAMNFGPNPNTVDLALFQSTVFNATHAVEFASSMIKELGDEAGKIIQKY